MKSYGAAPKKPVILIVDDQPENIRVLSALLKEDYISIAATSGQKGIDIARSDNRPDLIFLDISMPEMDGYEVCRRLKKDARTRNIPIIFLTGRNQLKDKIRGFEAGAADYLTKPFQLERLKARMRVHLRNSNYEIKDLFGLKKFFDRRFLIPQRSVLEKGIRCGGSKLMDNKTKILLIEHFEFTRKMEIELLKELGFSHFVEAATGLEAIQKLDGEKNIGLIFCDWNISDMSGCELLKKIRSDERFRRIPFVMVTDQGEYEQANKALIGGAEQFISKPFTARDLEMVIIPLLARREAE